MAITYNRNEKCGTATFNGYTTDLYVGNCFFLMVISHGDEDTLHSFFNDEEHLITCLKNGIYSDLVSIEINKAKCRNWKKVVNAIIEYTDSVSVKTYTDGEYIWKEWKTPAERIPNIRMRELAETAISYIKDRDELEDFCDDCEIEFDDEEKDYFGIYDDEESGVD